MTTPAATAGGGGNLALTALGAGSGIALGTAAATGNTVTLNAGGAITDGNSGTVNITADRLVASAGGGIDLDTNVIGVDVQTTGPGDIRIDELNALELDRVNAADGAVIANGGGDASVGQVSGDGVTLDAAGNVLIRVDGQIDGGGGGVVIEAGGDLSQEEGRGALAAVVGDTIDINAGGNVGLITLPLSVDAGGGSVAVDFSNNNAVAFVTGIFGSLNESPRVVGLASNSVLSNNVGAIQSSFEQRVSFKLDSSQFATETRIFAVEGTGILPPEDQRE
jgi:hypothetical protein